jgi:hypothetical protein
MLRLEVIEGRHNEMVCFLSKLRSRPFLAPKQGKDFIPTEVRAMITP